MARANMPAAWTPWRKCGSCKLWPTPSSWQPGWKDADAMHTTRSPSDWRAMRCSQNCALTAPSSTRANWRTPVTSWWTIWWMRRGRQASVEQRRLSLHPHHSRRAQSADPHPQPMPSRAQPISLNQRLPDPRRDHVDERHGDHDDDHDGAGFGGLKGAHDVPQNDADATRTHHAHDRGRAHVGFKPVERVGNPQGQYLGNDAENNFLQR